MTHIYRGSVADAPVPLLHPVRRVVLLDGDEFPSNPRVLGVELGKGPFALWLCSLGVAEVQYPSSYGKELASIPAAPRYDCDCAIWPWTAIREVHP
jgi:hypothetical protein